MILEALVISNPVCFLIVLAAVVGRIIYGLVQDTGDKLKVPSIGP